jgi:hypothetical protein
VIGVLAAALLWSIILPKRIAFPLDLVVLGVVFGNPMLRLLENLSSYVSRRIPQAIAFLIQLIERLIKQIRSGMRDRRWKSVLTSRSFNTAP